MVKVPWKGLDHGTTGRSRIPGQYPYSILRVRLNDRRPIDEPILV